MLLQTVKLVLDRHQAATSMQSAAAKDCATPGSAGVAAALQDSLTPEESSLMPAQAQHRPDNSCAQQQGAPEDAAAGTGATSAAASTGDSHRMLLGELTQNLQGSRCDVGLQVLWELAEQISADAAAAAGVPVLDLLLLLTNPTALEACEEAVRAFNSPERTSSMRVLRGLLQLLAQPMALSVLGWNQDQLRQQQASLQDLFNKALATEVTAAVQQDEHASPACSELLAEPGALGAAFQAVADLQTPTEQQTVSTGDEVCTHLLRAESGACTPLQQPTPVSAAAEASHEAPAAVHARGAQCSGLSDADAQAAAAKDAAAAAAAKHAAPSASSRLATGAVSQEMMQQVRPIPSAPFGAVAPAAMQLAPTAAAAAAEVAPNAAPAAPQLGLLHKQQQLILLQQLQLQQRFRMQLQQPAGLAAVLVAPAGAQQAAAVPQLPGHQVGQVAWQWTHPRCTVRVFAARTSRDCSHSSSSSKSSWNTAAGQATNASRSRYNHCCCSRRKCRHSNGSHCCSSSSSYGSCSGWRTSRQPQPAHCDCCLRARSSIAYDTAKVDQSMPAGRTQQQHRAVAA